MDTRDFDALVRRLAVLVGAVVVVVTAAGAQEALQALSAGPRIDVLVTDLDMPGRSGLHLVEAVRAQPRYAALPVVALASGPTAAFVEAARRLRIDDFVSKFDRAGLLAALLEGENASLGEAA